MTDGDSCKVCGTLLEYLLHIIRDCFTIRKVWKNILPPPYKSTFISMNFSSWIKVHIIQGKSLTVDKELSWDMVFALGCWWLWQWRNERVLNEGHSIQELTSFIISQAKQCLTAWLTNLNSAKDPPLRKKKLIGWVFPPRGWVKVNTDGTTKGNLDLAGGGGVIRDSTRSWLVGFTVNLDYCSSVLAEFWTFYHGLQFGKLVVEQLFQN